MGELTDIRSRFFFDHGFRGSYWFKLAEGELGVPGRVKTFRDETAQTNLSSGTGDHAGHMIGIQFGAPGDIRNLGLQNANMNTYVPKALQASFQGSGGSYLKRERDWRRLLLKGYRIEVTVVDHYRVSDRGTVAMRPYTRFVRWTESLGSETFERWLDFANFISPQLLQAGGHVPVATYTDNVLLFARRSR